MATILAKDVDSAGQGSGDRRPGRMLDLYGPAARSPTPRPVMLFVHGGAWRFGDKANVGAKPDAFVERGYLFASANYRLADSVSPRDQAQDVAVAVQWLHEHAAAHGGDPANIFLMGHSAGAHLVALVGTDDRFLKVCGLDVDAIRGVVLLDGAGYDVPRQIATSRLPRLKQLYERAFGDDEGAQREASPVTHVAAGRQHPPFLIFHVGTRSDSREQSELLAGKLRQAGGQATTVHEPDKTHLTLNQELGMLDDGPTEKIFAFLGELLDR